MKRVAQMTPKEAIAKIKKFEREHKGCSQLPIIMRIDHKAKKEDDVTASDLCCLYGAVHGYGYQWEKDIMPRFWHYGIDLDIGDDFLRIQILKIPGSKTEPNVAKRKWTTLKPEETGIYGAKYTKAYIDLRPGGRVYFEDGTCQPISKVNFPYFCQTTKGMRRLMPSIYSYRFPLPRDKALEIRDLLIRTYKKAASEWIYGKVTEDCQLYTGWLVNLATSQKYSNVRPKVETDREKEIDAMRKLIDVNKILLSCSPEELYMRSEKIGKVYMFYWPATRSGYINNVYVDRQIVFVTLINGKKTTSFYINRNNKAVEYVKNQDVYVGSAINMHGAIQIFKDHPKLSWVTELPCFSYIRPHQIPALEKAYPVEQFVKMGLPYAAEGCLYRGSFTTNREWYAFDVDYLKENTSVLKAYGIARKQAEYIDEKLRKGFDGRNDHNWYYQVYQGLTESIILMLRRIFGVEELSKRLGNDFDIFVDWLYGDDDCPEYPCWGDGSILEDPNTQKYKNLVRIIKMYVHELRKPHTKGRLNYFKDTINMWMCENHWNTEGFYGPNGIASTLRTPHDFQVLHDHLVEVRNARNNQRGGYYDKQRTLAEQAEFERKAKKALELLRDNYEYIGDSFRIVVPMTEAEITNEGQMLHHCVGGYATKHLERATTILFLRANETPDKSYYTIEVRGIGDGPYVVQIHGFGNKWIGNDPDAMRFAYHYFIDHNIRCDKSILLCTGHSYGGGGEALPESELY